MKIKEIDHPVLYHLSTVAGLTKLEPRIPRAIVNRIRGSFEDSSIERISFAETIDGCILGLQLSASSFSEHVQRFYVYRMVRCDRLLSNYEITRRALVFDSRVTGEWWGLSDAIVKQVGEIEVSDVGSRAIEYEPLRGDRRMMKKNGKLETYIYKWRVI
jgi:hypothetical protein